MQKIIENYSFDASEKKITFNDYETIEIENIISIINVTRSRVIYNQSSEKIGGSVSGNVLTLDDDTTRMGDNDDLQILYLYTTDVDEMTNVRGVILEEHSEIHEGDTYCISKIDESAGNNEYIEIFIKTPAVTDPQKRIHLVTEYSCSEAYKFEIFKGAVRTSGGSEFTPINRLGGSENESGAQETFLGENGGVIVFSAAGSIVWNECGGINQKAGGENRALQEWVLEPNTGYHFKLTSTAAGNKLFLGAVWYEHTDKNK